MGEITDLIIDGEFDYISGEYLGKGVGYPRTRENSSTKNARNGVSKFLKSKGFEVNENGAIAKEYAKDILNIQTTNYTKICEAIQQDFGRFAKWVKSKYCKP